MSLQAPLDHEDVELLSRETAYQGFFRIDKLLLRHRLIEGGWSDQFIRELQIKFAAIGMLLYDPDREEVVLVRQFRAGMLAEPASPWALELVAGMIDKDEEPLAVAIRETEEEANCAPEQVFPITTYFNSPGTTNEKVHLFCGRVDASGAGGVYGLDHEHEDIEVVVLPLQQLIDAVESGQINNAMTIIATLWLEKHRAEVKMRWGVTSS